MDNEGLLQQNGHWEIYKISQNMAWKIELKLFSLETIRHRSILMQLSVAQADYSTRSS